MRAAPEGCFPRLCLPSTRTPPPPTNWGRSAARPSSTGGSIRLRRGGLPGTLVEIVAELLRGFPGHAGIASGRMLLLNAGVTVGHGLAEDPALAFYVIPGPGVSSQRGARAVQEFPETHLHGWWGSTPSSPGPLFQGHRFLVKFPLEGAGGFFPLCSLAQGKAGTRKTQSSQAGSDHPHLLVQGSCSHWHALVPSYQLCCSGGGGVLLWWSWCVYRPESCDGLPTPLSHRSPLSPATQPPPPHPGPLPTPCPGELRPCVLRPAVPGRMRLGGAGGGGGGAARRAAVLQGAHAAGGVGFPGGLVRWLRRAPCQWCCPVLRGYVHQDTPVSLISSTFPHCAACFPRQRLNQC